MTKNEWKRPGKNADYGRRLNPDLAGAGSTAVWKPGGEYFFDE